MAIYHPPKIITNNAAPAISADLAYEGHGKCGQTRVIATSGEGEEAWTFDAQAEGTANAWKMALLNRGQPNEETECPCNYGANIRLFHANNISAEDCMKLQATFYTDIEIMADITYVQLDYHYAGAIAILYLDCEQS